MARIGLEKGKLSRPATAAKRLRDAEMIEDQSRVQDRLVGADRERIAFACQLTSMAPRTPS
jgi:hypothetical protein